MALPTPERGPFRCRPERESLLMSLSRYLMTGIAALCVLTLPAHAERIKDLDLDEEEEPSPEDEVDIGGDDDLGVGVGGKDDEEI